MLSEDQSDFPSLQSSVSPTGEVAGSARKKVGGMGLSEFLAHEDEQDKPGAQLGTKPKTLA